MQNLDKYLKIKTNKQVLQAHQIKVPLQNFGEVSLLSFDNVIGNFVFYPLTFDFRTYQYDIITKALYRNTLVCLPTGLGKTWIAAIIILNYYLWFPDGYIFFLAPTRPLVMQQIETLKLFEEIISEQELGVLLGKNTKRASIYLSQRILFMTPQTLLNDLKNKLFDSKKICLIVFDEAHRATGDYAYTLIVKILSEEKIGFRVLALSATPGNNMEKVQEVISNLCISELEYKDDQDPDVKKYIKNRKVKIEIIKNQDNQLVQNLNEKLVEIIAIVVKGILRYQVIPIQLISNFINADQITNGLCFMLREELLKNEQEIIRKVGQDNLNIIKNIFSLLCQLTFAKKVLIESGVISFIDYVTNLDQNMKPSHKQIITHLEPYIDFKKHVQSIKQKKINNHPKLVKMLEIIKEFFNKPQNLSKFAKVIVFTNNRGTAKEICEYINSQLSENLVRSSIFIGQQNKEGGIEGMPQKLQIEVMKKFKENVYNLLIATCIAEEGLDIGEVDLIICYDNGFSPIRMIQRMGRTGRKRDGEIIILLMEGQVKFYFLQYSCQEQRNYEKQKKEGKKIKQQIKQSSKDGKQQNHIHKTKQESKLNFYSFSPLMVPENHSQTLIQFTDPLNCKELEDFIQQKNYKQVL